MTRVSVRSEALHAAAAQVDALADEVRGECARVASSLARAGPPLASGRSGLALVVRWARLEAAVIRVLGPAGAWGEAVALDALAVHLRAAARVYEGVERSVLAVLAGVRGAADLTTRGGLFGERGRGAAVRSVPPTLDLSRLTPSTGVGGVGGAAGLVAAGAGLGGGRVRVLETTRGDRGSAWVVVVPGTQEWSPRPGPNPFDLTTDVRALTGDATVAAAGVTAALEEARAASGRSTAVDPVLLVGHSQGGILAAALAADPAFSARHRVTHVLTSGAPTALFPVTAAVRVLSVEHTDDPVPRLDLTPNPSSATWVTVTAARGIAPVDVASHAREAYVRTLAALEGAPPGTVAGLDAWQASAGAFLGRPVRSVAEFEVERS